MAKRGLLRVRYVLGESRPFSRVSVEGSRTFSFFRFRFRSVKWYGHVVIFINFAGNIFDMSRKKLVFPSGGDNFLESKG